MNERNNLIIISYQLLISLAGPLVLFVELLPQMTQGTGFFIGIIMQTTILYKAFRPTTESIIKGEIPEEVGTDTEDCVQWIGEEYDWQFIPLEFKVMKLTGKDIT